MRKHPIMTALLGLLLLLPNSVRPANSPDPSAKASIARSLSLIEMSALRYTQKRECFSCHHQALPVVTLVEARKRGFPVAADKVQQLVRFTCREQRIERESLGILALLGNDNRNDAPKTGNLPVDVKHLRL